RWAKFPAPIRNPFSLRNATRDHARIARLAPIPPISGHDRHEHLALYEFAGKCRWVVDAVPRPELRRLSRSSKPMAFACWGLLLDREKTPGCREMGAPQSGPAWKRWD